MTENPIVYFGRPIESLSREELMDCIRWLVRNQEMERRDAKRAIDILTLPRLN